MSSNASASRSMSALVVPSPIDSCTALIDGYRDKLAEWMRRSQASCALVWRIAS
jgi:hypothetical protein